MSWQLQEAKQKFSDLVERTLREGPQVVSRRGEDVVVVIPIEEYDRMAHGGKDFKDFLCSAPDLEQLDIHRSAEPTRAVAFP